MTVNSMAFYNINQTNPNYLVSIFGSDEQGNTIGTSKNPYGGIISPIPEDFSLETSSTWHSLLDGILKTVAHTFIGGTNVGQLAIGATQALTGAFGSSLVNKAASQLLWESTSPVTFSLPLKFDALQSAFSEVTEPINQLLKLTLPSDGKLFDSNSTFSGFNAIVPLNAPGPSFSPNSQYDISIAIGNMFIFPKVIITGVSATFHTISVQAGDFISADVNLGVSTSTILTKSDLDLVFKNRGTFRNSRPALNPSFGGEQ